MSVPSDSEVAAGAATAPGRGARIPGDPAARVLARTEPPSWDEAIYLSQVAPGAEALPFVPSRARGITFLAIPVLQLGGSLAQLRLFLAVASAAALTAAFRMWAPVIGFGAVAAALLFAAAWPALFYGSELMPNLWVALVCVAATAVLARRLASRRGSVRRAARRRARRARGADPTARRRRPDGRARSAPDRRAAGDDLLDRPSRARSGRRVGAVAGGDGRAIRVTRGGVRRGGATRAHGAMVAAREHRGSTSR